MKKQTMFYGALLCAAVIMSVFYACKKNEPGASATNPATPLSSGNTANRTAGERTYYSKNMNNVVYKMVLTTNEEGIVSVDRSVYSTNQPDTFKTRIYRGEGVVFEDYTYNPATNRYEGDTVKVRVPDDRTYYVIPFEIGLEPKIKPGGAAVYCHCHCGCSNPAECDWCLENGPTDESLECLSLCASCWVESTALTDNPDPNDPNSAWTGAANVGGFVIVDSNGYTIVH